MEVVWVPTPPVVQEPEDGERFLSDQEVVVTIETDRMGFPPGSELMVEVTSSLSGTLVTLSGLENQTISLGELEPGVHLVTVTVSDGEHASGTTFTIEVERSTSELGPWPFILLWVSLAAVVVLVVLVLRMRGGRGGRRGPVPHRPTGRP